MKRVVIILFCGFIQIAGANPLPLLADVIRLHHGGEVRGHLEETTTNAEAPLVIRMLSGAVVKLERAEADFVERRSLVIEEYLSRNRRIEPSVESHWQLAEWCRQHLLKDQRSEQLELLLQIDPDHADARRLLGYVQHHGKWILREEMMASRGYVKHKNKWITTQELALIEKNAVQREAELIWYPKIRLWLGWVQGNDAHRRTAGLAEFETLQEKNAIPALMKLMAAHDQMQVRQLYVSVLSRIPGERAIQALLDRYLYDSEPLVWGQAFAAITPSQHSAAIPMLISALTNDSNVVVQRAATALGDIGSEESVPTLITALITTHQFRVEVVQSQPISFGSAGNGRVGMVDPRQANGTLPPDIVALARLGQLPYGVQVIPYNMTPKNTKTVTVQVDLKNAAVLAALQKITQKNLGYNEYDWHLWWSVYKS